MAIQTLRISDESIFEKQKHHLLKVFEGSGYSRSIGLRAFEKGIKGPKQNKDSIDFVNYVYIPFILGTSNKIAHIIKKNNLNTTFKPLNAIHSSLRSIKDHVDPKEFKGVYLISCSYGAPYIGEIDHSIKQRIQGHVVDINHSRSHSFALAKHAEKSKHHICIEDSKVIAKIDHFH